MGVVIIVTGLVVAILGVVGAVNGLAIYETTFGTALVTLGGIGVVGGVVILVLGVIQRTLARIVQRLDSVIQFEMDEAEQHRFDHHHGDDSPTSPVRLNLDLAAPPVPLTPMPASVFTEAQKPTTPPLPTTPPPRRPPPAAESPPPEAGLGTLPSWFQREPDEAPAAAAPETPAPPPAPEPATAEPAKPEPAKPEPTSWFRRGRETAPAAPPAAPAPAPVAATPAPSSPPVPHATLGPLDPADEHDPFGPAPTHPEAAWEKQMQEDFANSAPLEPSRAAAPRVEPTRPPQVQPPQAPPPLPPAAELPPAAVPDMPRMPQGGGFAQPPMPRSIVVLKSGIIGGMAYKLYSDGSIEAELPDGQLRFASLQELREHVSREPDAG